MRTAARLYTRVISICGGVAFLAGCNADFSGFEDLLDASPTYLNLPGRRVAQGLFRHPVIDGTDQSGPYVAAFDVEKNSSWRLAIVPFGGGEPCRTASAARFQTSVYPTSAKLDLVMPYVEPPMGDQAQRLHFVDPTCRDVVDPVPSSGLPLSVNWLFEDPPGYLTITREGRLVFVEPWNGVAREITTGVSLIGFDQKRIWTVEGGAVVVRNQAFKEVGRFGTGVTELALTTVNGLRAAYVEEGGNLYVVDDDLADPVLMDSDVCNVAFPTSWNGFGMSYHSPCADHRLVLRELIQRSSGRVKMVDSRYEIASGTTTHIPEIRSVSDDLFVFYLTTEPNSSPGTLWGGKVGSTMERIGDNAVLDGITTPKSNEWRALVDRHDVTDPKGHVTTVSRLVQWHPGTAAREVAQDVAKIQGSMAIVHFDGIVGDAVFLNNDGKTALLARRVPPDGMISDLDADGRALLTDFDGTTGTLLVTAADSFDYEVVGSGIALHALGFVLNLDAIGYLHDYDPDTGDGTLAVRVIDTADTFDAGVRTSEWREIYWPEPGILYVVSEGDQAGIWFARLL